MSKDTGGSAFPIFPETAGGHAAAFHGMTLRDYFASKAIPMLCEKYWDLFMEDLCDLPDNSAKISREAYAIADAMLEERKK